MSDDAVNADLPINADKTGVDHGDKQILTSGKKGHGQEPDDEGAYDIQEGHTASV